MGMSTFLSKSMTQFSPDLRVIIRTSWRRSGKGRRFRSSRGEVDPSDGGMYPMVDLRIEKVVAKAINGKSLRIPNLVHSCNSCNLSKVHTYLATTDEK